MLIGGVVVGAVTQAFNNYQKDIKINIDLQEEDNDPNTF